VFVCYTAALQSVNKSPLHARRALQRYDIQQHLLTWHDCSKSISCDNCCLQCALKVCLLLTVIYCICCTNNQTGDAEETAVAIATSVGFYDKSLHRTLSGPEMERMSTAELEVAIYLCVALLMAYITLSTAAVEACCVSSERTTYSREVLLNVD
jgi:hypothetical protein